MHRLEPSEWTHVLAHLPTEDAAALALTSPALTLTLKKAQSLRMTRAVQTARLVTVLHTSQGAREVVVSAPASPAAHSVGDLLLPRRLFVHGFPEVCLHALGTRPLCHVESFLAFEAAQAHTLPLVWAAPVQEAPGLLPWLHSRLSTYMHSQDPRDWRAVLRIHARFFVGCRTGLPRRQRGRRMQRWTKLARRDARAVRSWVEACLHL